MFHRHVPGQPNKFIHEPNFVSAKISCKKCIENGNWEKSLKDAEEEDKCPICGPHRTVTFGHRGFKDTPVDKHNITETPMKDFVQWLLYDFGSSYESYIFSHFGN
jgi:hypothetical protein